MTPRELHDELKRLAGLAADGPWFTAVQRSDGLTTVEDGREDGLFPFHCETHEAALVVALVNNLPAILSALRAVEGAKVALRFYANPPKGTRVPDFYDELEFGETARTALTHLEGLK